MLMLFMRKCSVRVANVNELRRRFSLSLFNMSQMNVRCVPEEERLNLTFDYNGGNKCRTFRFDRLKIEKLGCLIQRIQKSVVEKSYNKKKKKQKLEGAGNGDAEIPPPVVSIAMDGRIVDLERTIEDVFVEGTVMTVGEQSFSVVYNPPTVTKLQISNKIMAGFPVIPKVESEFTNLDKSEFQWFRVKTKLVKLKPGFVPEDCEFVEMAEVGQGLIYTPSIDDLGYLLLLKTVPKSDVLEGKMIKALSKFEVGAGPGLCPFETRHLYTQKVAEKNSFRVISYNILADLYADSDFTRNELFPYCATYALEYDYRIQLLLKEIIGYNSDILCMQEVDRKAFVSVFQPSLGKLGFSGIQVLKDGNVNEGEAIFFRTSKFRLVGEHNIVFRNYLTTDQKCADILAKVSQNEKVLTNVCKRGSILQVAALERVDTPNHKLIVANTHFFFHPPADNIRMIQTLLSVRHLENIVQLYREQGLKSAKQLRSYADGVTHFFFHPPADNIRMIQTLLSVRHLENIVQLYREQGNTVSLIFCGDFNSRPARGVNNYLVNGQVSRDISDWTYDNTEHLKDMDFSHSLHLKSACGYPRYTNYVGNFHETLDYIFMDTNNLEVLQVIPPPEHEEVTAHTALPSVVFPSDHIAQICDITWKNSAE